MDPNKRSTSGGARYQEKTRGLLIVNTGNGKGKTTCALGPLMRAAGSRPEVLHDSIHEVGAPIAMVNTSLPKS